MNILIADDNNSVRHGVATILASRTDLIVCGEAADGNEAIRKARDLQPDLIVLDISMPGMDGLQVTRQLRSSLNHAKIVIMSQHDPSLLAPEALAAGADACLDKNCLSIDLLPTIDRMRAVSAAASIAKQAMKQASA